MNTIDKQKAIVTALENNELDDNGIPYRSMNTRTLGAAFNASHQTAAKARRKAGLSQRYAVDIELTLTDEQSAQLDAICTALNLKMTEAVRQAIEFYYIHKLGGL